MWRTCGSLEIQQNNMWKVSSKEISKCLQMPVFNILYLMNEILWLINVSKFFWGLPKALLLLKRKRKKEEKAILVTFEYFSKSQAEVSRCTSQNSPPAHTTPACANMKVEPLQEASTQKKQCKIFSTEVSNHCHFQIWDFLTWTDSFLSSFGNIL